MASVKWIKINVDMFSDEKIKILQSMPDGDSILLVWIKLIMLAGKTNDGGYIYIADNMPYTPEMLSVIMNKPLTTIKLALDTFIKLGMIENDEKGIYLVNFEKHQSLDKMQEIREYNRLAQQKHRERIKSQKMSLTSQDCQETDIDKDIDIEVDIDKEKEIYKEKENNNINNNILDNNILSGSLSLEEDDVGVVEDNFTEVLEKDSSEVDEKDKAFFRFIEKEFRRTLSPTEVVNLQTWRTMYSDEIIKYAIEKASLANVKKVSYIIGILKNWWANEWYDLKRIKEETQ